MRAWHLYVAHILLFLIFTAQIARAARKFDNPMYKDEFNVANFLAHPDELIWQALTLRYKPVDLDVLPLFIVAGARFAAGSVVSGAPPEPDLARLGDPVRSGSLVRLESRFISTGDDWYFNPFAWQLLFFFAAWCSVGGAAKILASDSVAHSVCDILAWIALRLHDRDDLAQRTSWNR